MNTDTQVDLVKPANTRLLLQAETEKILGCAFDVINEVGHGFHEKIYENSLIVALQLAEIPHDQQRTFPVLFRGRQVGLYVPDLLAFSKVIVDIKVIDKITDHERGQMLNYLRISKLRVGLIINFKHARLEWERVVL